MFRYLYQKQLPKFVCLVVISIVSCLFEIGLAYVMLQCVDYAMTGKMTDALSYAIWLILYILVFFLVDFWAKRLKWQVLRGAQINLRNDVMSRIFSMTTDKFHEKNTSGWLSTLTNQLDMIEESYFKIWFGVFTEIFEFAVSLVFLCLISPWLTLFVLGVTAVQMIIPRSMSPLLAKKKAEQTAAAEEFNVVVTEHLAGFDLLRSFQLTAKSLQAISTANHRWEESKYRTRIFTTLARLLSFTFGQVIYVGIYFFGALLTILGHMTVGAMIAASQLVVYIASPLQTLSDDITEIKSAREIINGLENEVSCIQEDLDQHVDVPDKFREIEFRHVTFSYEDHLIIRDACLGLQHGEKYLLRGLSGAGKSTFVQLLTGALRPDEGQIVVDGIDIQCIDKAQYARFILSCTQNTFIFNASLRDNITLFNESFSDEVILKAIKTVGLSYVLKNFEDGLDHMVSQGGYALSGGERQKIALARMELYQPQVVVFDESFANIDLKTTEKLIRRITSETDQTVILIAHQLPEKIASYFDQYITIDGAQVTIKDEI